MNASESIGSLHIKIKTMKQELSKMTLEYDKERKRELITRLHQQINRLDSQVRDIIYETNNNHRNN